MKKLSISLLLLLLLPSMALAQGGEFKINGVIKNPGNATKIYLVYVINGQKVADSSNIENGKFSFSGEVPDIVAAHMRLGEADKPAPEMITHGDHKTFLISPGEMTITIDKIVSEAVISGSQLNDDWDEYNKMMSAFMVNARKVKADFDAIPAEQRTPEMKSIIMAKMDSLMATRSDLLHNFIIMHPNSAISLQAIGELISSEENNATISKLFNSLSKELRESERGNIYLAKINVDKNTGIGEIAPDFTQNTPDGTPVTLSSMRGKYVLLDFWASWCGPCRAENPNLVANYNKYKDRGFDILGVSMDEEAQRAAWLATIEKDKLTWTQVSDLKGWGNEAGRLYGVDAIPRNFLLDPEGRIIARNLRGSELGAKLAEIFKISE